MLRQLFTSMKFRTARLALLLLAVISLVGINLPQIGGKVAAASSPSGDDNTAIAQAAFAAINTLLQTGKVTDLDKIFSKDYIDHSRADDAMGDLAQLKQDLKDFRKAFPDGSVTVEDIVASNTEVVVRSTWQGTQKGAYASIPASNLPVSYEQIDIFAIADGKIAERWGQSDTVGLLGQIGALAALSGASPTQPTTATQPATSRQPGSRQFGVQTKTSNCAASGDLPDSACTPGAISPGVTPAQLCVPGYAHSVRNVSTAEKDQVYAEYGISSHKTGQYEVDHLISLELGGSNEIANLWPELASPKPGFHEKDKVENYMHSQVCSGAVTLQQAQQEIATNWLALYQQMPK